MRPIDLKVSKNRTILRLGWDGSLEKASEPLEKLIGRWETEGAKTTFAVTCAMSFFLGSR